MAAPSGCDGRIVETLDCCAEAADLLDTIGFVGVVVFAGGCWMLPLVVTGAGKGLLVVSDPVCAADTVVGAIGIASAIFASSISPSSPS